MLEPICHQSFTGCQELQNFIIIFDSVAFVVRLVNNEAIYHNLKTKTNSLSIDHCSMFFLNFVQFSLTLRNSSSFKWRRNIHCYLF